MDKSYFLTLIAVVAVVAGLFYGAYYFESHTNISQNVADYFSATNQSSNEPRSSSTEDAGSLFDKTSMTPTSTPQVSVRIEDERIGTGTEAKAGDSITVNYLGTLLNGTKFDSSYDRGTPLTFTLGAGKVIRGWDQGLQAMKVGGKRKLTIPPDLAYGAQSPNPKIPANSTLVFEVELLKVEVK